MNENEVKKCQTCNLEMEFAERAEFRILPLEIYVCPQCGRVELFADDETKQRLLKLAGGKNE
jgi:predicted RNA-binding Zn-ribbon protein involved in translation (DUF1610 family)